MKLTKENLINCFNEAIEGNFKYIGIIEDRKGRKEIKIIFNENFDCELCFYDKFLDEDLLSPMLSVNMLGFSYGNLLADIEKDLIG